MGITSQDLSRLWVRRGITQVRGVPKIEDAVEGAFAIAERRAELSRRDVNDEDLVVVSEILTFLLPHKDDGYSAYVQAIRPALLNGAAIDVGVRERARRFFGDDFLKLPKEKVETILLRRPVFGRKPGPWEEAMTIVNLSALEPGWPKPPGDGVTYFGS